MLQNLPSDALSDRRGLLAGLAGTLLFATGCGVQTYEDRLAETQKYFAYLDKVNLALGSKIVPFEGVEIRVPKPFVQILPPPPPKDGESQSQSSDPNDDPTRLGFYPDVQLEGVLASWRAKVNLEPSGDGIAYLHLLSNLPRWVEKQTNNDIEPHRYLGDLTNVLAAPNAFNMTSDSTDNPWSWEPLRILSDYVGKKRIDSFAIPPEIETKNNAVVLYRMELKDVHVAMVLIYPRAMDVRLNFEERMKHTFESLKIPVQPPQKKANKPTIGGF